MKKKTLILGASSNPDRYSYTALKLLNRYGHPVVAVGHKAAVVEGITIQNQMVEETEVDTITLYLSPKNQIAYYDYILKIRPKRVIFNPGTENSELEEILQQNDIQPFIGCTLVMLQTGQY